MPGDLFLVVLPVEDLPLVGALNDRALLALDLAADEGVDGLVRLHLVGDQLDDLLADLLGVGEVLDRVVLVEVPQDEVGEAEDLLPGELHPLPPGAGLTGRSPSPGPSSS